MTPDRLALGVLASGSGTNLQALLDTVHGAEAEIVGVGSDREDARALERARQAGVETATFPGSAYPDRASRDVAMADWLEGRGARLVVLAGYMQLVSAAFLARFPGRVINVHPSLLPAFPGMRAIEQALDHGVKVTGVTVHFVDEGVDTGAILLQEAVAVGDAADADELHRRLQVAEHRLLPEAVRLLAAGAVSFDAGNPRRTRIAGRTG